MTPLAIRRGDIYFSLDKSPKIRRHFEQQDKSARLLQFDRTDFSLGEAGFEMTQ